VHPLTDPLHLDARFSPLRVYRMAFGIVILATAYTGIMNRAE